MTRNRLIIVIAAALLAAGAGVAWTQGLLPGSESGPTVKVPMQPIPMAEPFTLNLADTDERAYIAFNVAIELEPMTQADYDIFMGNTGGGHGGGGEAPGPGVVATYPKFRDAVIAEAAGFRMEELLADPDRTALKKAIVDRFHEIELQDEALLKSAGHGETHHDPTHPPFKVKDVQIVSFAIQSDGGR